MCTYRFASYLLAVTVSVGLFSHGAEASPILFTDRAVFDAVAQPNRSVTFDADALDCQWSNFVCSHTFDGFFNVAYDVGAVGLLGDTVGLGPWGGFNVGGQGFLQPVAAIGFDLVSLPTLPQYLGNAVWDPSPQPAQFHFAGTTFQFGAGDAGLPQFIGIILDEPATGNIPAVATVNYAPGGFGYAIKNLVVVTVPEPSTLLLLSSGIVALWQGRRFLSRR